MLINTENKLVFDSIVAIAKKNGISITELCERAKVSKDTVSNWKHRNPSSVNTLMAIQNIQWDKKPEKNPWEMFFGEILEDSCRKAFKAGAKALGDFEKNGGQFESFEDWYEKLVKSSK